MCIRDSDWRRESQRVPLLAALFATSVRRRRTSHAIHYRLRWRMRRKILCGRISWAKAASLVATTFRGFRDIPWRLAQLRRENLGEPVCLTPPVSYTHLTLPTSDLV